MKKPTIISSFILILPHSISSFQHIPLRSVVRTNYKHQQLQRSQKNPFPTSSTFCGGSRSPCPSPRIQQQRRGSESSLYAIQAAQGQTSVNASRNELQALSVTALSGVMLWIMFLAGDWRYYLAGGLAASLSHAVATPIDVIKTYEQVNPDAKGSKNNIWKIAKENPKILIAGLGPTTWGYLLEGAAKFGVYEMLKEVQYLTVLPQRAQKVLAGIVSGVVASLMLCPMEALRIRLVSEPDFEGDQTGPFKSIRWLNVGLSMVRNEGLQGFYKGLNAMLTKQIPYTVVKQVSFDMITAFVYTFLLTSGTELCNKVKLVVPLISAMIASVLSCVASHPGDMLLSVVNAHEGKKRLREFSKEIFKRDGPKGFFVGINARFLHVGLIVTAQLMIYDSVKRLCGIGATGL